MELEEDVERALVQILHPSAPADKKGSAVQYLLEMTGTEEGCSLIRDKTKLLEALLQLQFDNNSGVKQLARKCMINLTAHDTVVLALIQMEGCVKDMTGKLLEECLDLKQTNNTACCVLTNMTRVEQGAMFVSGVVLDTQTVALAKLVDVLCSLHTNQGETFPALCSLLMNLTQVPRMRRGLMEGPAHLLLRLLPIISLSSSLAPCRGIVGAIKNCCFEYDFHQWLLGEEVDLLPRLLMPLAGPEEFDDDDMDRLPPDLQYLPDTKTREADPQVRNMLVQALNKLCSTKAGRLFLKEKNAYIILRELHKWEPCEENGESLFNVIDILIADEPEKGMEDLHNVQIPPDVLQSFQQEDLKREAK